MKNKGEYSDISSQSKKELIRLLNAYREAINESLISSIADANGNIIYANKKFCEITQYNEVELVGKNHRIINSGFHSKEFFTELWNTISAGRVWRGEIRNKTKTGVFYWVDTVILPIKNDEGNIIQYLSLRALINEKKKAEEERIKYIHSMEEMLQMTSHEVRKPIANCLGLTSEIDLQNASKEELIEIFNHLKSSAIELDNFTKKLTDFIYEQKQNRIND